MPDKPSQADKFREAAREVETDDREEAFDAALRKIAKKGTTSKEEPSAQ